MIFDYRINHEKHLEIIECKILKIKLEQKLFTVDLILLKFIENLDLNQRNLIIFLKLIIVHQTFLITEQKPIFAIDPKPSSLQNQQSFDNFFIKLGYTHYAYPVI